MRHNLLIPGILMGLSIMPPLATAQEQEIYNEERATWLGVQLTPVPAALAAHLQIEDAGLMIRNVFIDSPADQSGLQRYDVIVEADGKKVAPDVRSFSEHIRSMAPGRPLGLRIYRQAKSLALPIHLAPQPHDGRMELKYPDDPDVIHRKNFGMRGKILRPGPNGWVLEDLGELPDAEWLTDFRGDDDDARPSRPNQARRVDKNGQVLHVRRLKDGAIEVRRYEFGHEPKESDAKIFANLEELFKADPEAADLLKSAQESDTRLPGERRSPRWQEWRDRFFQGPLSDPRRHPRDQQISPEPNVRFEVQANGEIRVKTRQQDAELEMTFSSPEDFKARTPELFKRFDAMNKELQ